MFISAIYTVESLTMSALVRDNRRGEVLLLSAAPPKFCCLLGTQHGKNGEGFYGIAGVRSDKGEV